MEWFDLITLSWSFVVNVRDKETTFLHEYLVFQNFICLLNMLSCQFHGILVAKMSGRRCGLTTLQTTGLMGKTCSFSSAAVMQSRGSAIDPRVPIIPSSVFPYTGVVVPDAVGAFWFPPVKKRGGGLQVEQVEQVNCPFSLHVSTSG